MNRRTRIVGTVAILVAVMSATAVSLFETIDSPSRVGSYSTNEDRDANIDIVHLSNTLEQQSARSSAAHIALLDAESGVAHVPSTRIEILDLEVAAVVGNAFSTDFFFFGPMSSDAVFRGLVGQFREKPSREGTMQRATYEAMFYSQPQISDGSVALELLECGVSICAAEFWANDQELLDQFIVEAKSMSDFSSRASIQLPGLTGNSAGASRRLVFSHDPAIQGATVPSGGRLEGQ